MDMLERPIIGRYSWTHEDLLLKPETMKSKADVILNQLSSVRNVLYALREVLSSGFSPKEGEDETGDITIEVLDISDEEDSDWELEEEVEEDDSATVRVFKPVAHTDTDEEVLMKLTPSKLERLEVSYGQEEDILLFGSYYGRMIGPETMRGLYAAVLTSLLRRVNPVKSESPRNDLQALCNYFMNSLTWILRSPTTYRRE